MWPCLVPGDLVSTEMVEARSVSPGDVLVVPGAGGRNVVHRLRGMRSEAGGLVLVTGGDRSGEDEPTVVRPGAELRRVTGVLRGGRWRRPSGRFILAPLVPGIILRAHCWLVRRRGHRPAPP